MVKLVQRPDVMRCGSSGLTALLDISVAVEANRVKDVAPAYATSQTSIDSCEGR